MLYTEYDYLSNESFFLDDIGNVKCPTLRDIRKITYSLFSVYVNLLTISKDEFLARENMLEKYNQLSDSQKEFNSIFRLLFTFTPTTLKDLVQHFSYGTVFLDINTMDIKIHDKNRAVTGVINNSNFEYFRNSIASILGITNIETQKPKYKSERARILCEKLEKSKLKTHTSNDPNYTLDNMILKYCTYNTVGINMLNVWDLTYYQFIKLFCELVSAKEISYLNSIASNTFSFTEENAKSFDRNLWINKLNKN